MTRKLLAEVFGTFCLVFAGTGAIVVNDVSGGSVTHVGVALTFGLIVFAMIQAVGDVSGAHLNPAVTLGLVAARRFAARDAVPYVVSQLLGAFAASGLLRFLFPDHLTLGSTLPAGTQMQSFAFEFVMTAMLMFVVLCVTTGGSEKGITAGLAIGAVIALEAMFGGPVSGASMNPARSIAPAVVSMNLASLWLYVLAPAAGSVIAVAGCRCVREPGCCSGSTTQT